MNKKRVSAQFLLYFLSMMFLMVIGCSSSGSGLLITYNISGTVTGAANVTITLTGPSPGSTTTDASGNYSFKGMDGTYTVVPSKTGYEFNPISRVVVVKDADVVVGPFTATSIGNTPTYKISGTVTGASYVSLQLTGDKQGWAATDSNGNFSFTVVNGSYTIRPIMAGYAFNPISSAVTVSGTPRPNINFAATYIGNDVPTYTISGTVTGAVLKGVTITLIGDENGSVATISDGTYSFPPVMNGTYTVVPLMADYKFSPISRVVVVNGAPRPNIDFAATYIGNDVSTYTISGQVTGAVKKNVTIALGGDNTGAVATDSNGNYIFPPLVTGNYTVKPYLKGYSFSPYNYNITSLNSTNGLNKDFTAWAIAYRQADLEGIWHVHMLKTGAHNGWSLETLAFDSDGKLTAASNCRNSATTSTTCPTDLTWKIDPSTGVITESGTDAGTASHITMSSNKNLIVGTDGNTDFQLMIAQKDNHQNVLMGTAYYASDVQNISSFVFHQLMVGANKSWVHGTGATLFGAVNIFVPVGPYGTVTMENWGNLSVNTNGFVTMSGGDIANFDGFLSDDKKTIVGTYTYGGSYKLMIIQINDRNDYTADALTGTSFGHILAAGAAPAPFWAYETVTADSIGDMTFSILDSSVSVSIPAATTGSIDEYGVVIITGSDFNGQISNDGLFTVGTETTNLGLSDEYYSLIVTTR